MLKTKECMSYSILCIESKRKISYMIKIPGNSRKWKAIYSDKSRSTVA